MDNFGSKLAEAQSLAAQYKQTIDQQNAIIAQELAAAQTVRVTAGASSVQIILLLHQAIKRTIQQVLIPEVPTVTVPIVPHPAVLLIPEVQAQDPDPVLQL